jgi:phospholipid/cholesterol/gamma-HCH transport system ATP-binding protein
MTSSPHHDDAAPVRLAGVSLRRGGREILHDIDLVVPRGRITAVMGPSGTGKTSLLGLVSGELSPSRGRVFVEGQDLTALDRRGLYTLRRRMGMLFQEGALFTDLSVFENVAFPLREHTRLPEELVRAIVLLKLEAVGLRGAAGLYPSELSGGMARRAALARAVVMDPALVLYDEPLTGLDPISMGVILRLIRELNRTLGLTSVVVSHDVQEMLAVADHFYLLADGRIIAQGDRASIRAQAESSPWVHQFLEGEADGPVPFHYPARPLWDDLLAEEAA